MTVSHRQMSDAAPVGKDSFSSASSNYYILCDQTEIQPLISYYFYMFILLTFTLANSCMATRHEYCICTLSSFAL